MSEDQNYNTSASPHPSLEEENEDEMASEDKRLDGHHFGYADDSWNSQAPQVVPLEIVSTGSIGLQTSIDPLISTTIEGKYSIDDTLGRGAMAVVYSGRQLSNNRPVALKKLSIHSTEGIMRFSREIRNHSQLKHPNIVEFFEFIGSNGQFFLVMELAKGSGLQEVIRKVGRVDSPKNIASIMIQLCDALIYAHSCNVVHRDLKPSNIILVKNPDSDEIRVKVLDFGIAQVKGEQRITLSGRAVGSPLYMSPEQCQGQTPTALSDIYALGVICYEMLVGQPPYMKGTVQDIVASHCTPEIMPVPVSQMMPHIKGGKLLDQIIFKCIQTEPAKRWQTAKALKEAFDFWNNAIASEDLPDSLPDSMLSCNTITDQDSSTTLPKKSLAELYDSEAAEDKKAKQILRARARRDALIKKHAAALCISVVAFIMLIILLVYLYFTGTFKH